MTDPKIWREAAAPRGDIAIVGMSCLFPGAPDLDTYWQNIVSKVDATTDPPADAWDPDLYYHPDSKSNDRVYCKRGGYIADIARFRPTDFGVMPANVEGGEPDQWLALQLAYAALADAGYPETPPEHIQTEVIIGKGTYINRGNMTVGYHGMVVEQILQLLKNLHPEYGDAEIAAIKTELKAGLPPFSADTAPALIGNIIAGRVANRLDLMGPSFTVDGACASALLAIEIGVRDLLTGKCDLVIAGGANVNLPLPTLILFCQLNALSKREQIRPFDKDADGTLLGEGLGMIVLKRLDDAQRAKDRIYAVIKGVGTASDGRGQHVMAPRIEGEELALRRAYDMAGILPESVGLIEAHGTATPVGDVVEVQALTRIFGARTSMLPSCALGSVKSMIGHTMPAAGIAGLIKTALALYHRVLPPTINCTEPNPRFELEKTPFYVNTETRPWIHGWDTPRRAGVNAFGFGGINGHVVLEELASSNGPQRSHLLLWDTEVCILGASTRSELVEKGLMLREALARSGTISLKDVAYTLNSELQKEPYRLSIIASSVDDLTQKLGQALSRLADATCRQIKDNRGIYFFEEPLSRQGKLALMFPGEGAQYPNMLADLCLHFPEVRACFDSVDKALRAHPRGYVPSDFIFPRSIVPASEREAMEDRLWQIDGAVEAVLTANSAMWALLRRLGLQPDVIVGHSTGDYSAMFAAGMIELTDAVLAWNSAHNRLAQELAVPEVALLAVAADSTTVRSVAQQVGDAIHVAMENCPHQNVILGPKDAVDRAIAIFRERGVIYESLPFDRPYHTPLFRPYAEGACDEFFSKLSISASEVDTYSCTTASLYPVTAAEIKDLYVAHWVQPVLFQKTIEKMYADGVRIFVEAGPRGNLTAFVADILRGRPHLAMPANVAARSGLTQLNHLLGLLAAQGFDLNWGHLYARRDPHRINLAHPDVAEKARGRAMKLALGMPGLNVRPRQFRTPASEPSAAAPAPVTRAVPADNPLPPGEPTQSGASSATADRTRSAGDAFVIQKHLEGMANFLDVQQKVMQAFLERTGAGAVVGDTAVRGPSTQVFPLLGQITSVSPGRRLTAERQVTRRDDTFLNDHALGGAVSRTDPNLTPIVVVPLTMSMEILAEAAAALMEGQVVVGMRDVEASRWIRVEEESVTLQISAVRSVQNPREVEVRMTVSVPTAEPAKTTQTPAIRAVVLVGEGYPTPPPLSGFRLDEERVPRLAASNLYDGRVMFHGPCFQGVASVKRSGIDGLVGELRVLPASGLFRTIRDPQFVTDPVLLDAAGQLVGFWAKEYLPRGFVVFPYRLKALRLYGPGRPVGDRCECRVRLELLGQDRTRSDFDIVTPDGTIWMQLTGWEDRRFDPPARFHQFWTSPQDAHFSDPWPAPLALLPTNGALECRRLHRPFDSEQDFWGDLWSSLVLTRKERGQFQDAKWAPARRHEWLSARTAAKDAARILLHRRFRLDLLPADIEIGKDEHGRPMLSGPWSAGLPVVPQVSLAHSRGTALAVVGDVACGQHLGVDLETIRELPDSFESVALSSDERALFTGLPPVSRAEWILRLWCAKEALGKALGRGLPDGPRSVEIVGIQNGTGILEARILGRLAEAFPDLADAKFIVYTMRDQTHVVALTLCERRTL
jgi:acyl transferase domain-containing protein/phosphopantetheinyl transferase